MAAPLSQGSFAHITRLRSRLQRLSLHPQEFQRLCRRYGSSGNSLPNTESRLLRVASPTRLPSSAYHRKGTVSTHSGNRSYTISPAQLSDASDNASKLNSQSSNAQSGNMSDAVRRLMRHVPHPVAVITATDLSLSPDGGPEGWRGATVSSFNTVTLLPRPVVSFNIRKISSTYDAIRSSGHFYVHLLSEDAKEAHRIASKFTKGNASYPFHDDNGELEGFALVSDVQPNAKRMPPILHFENEAGDLVVPFRLHCRYLKDKVVEIGDHVVLFGEVDHVFHDVGAFYGQSSEKPISCLVYVDGSYCRVAVKSKPSQ